MILRAQKEAAFQGFCLLTLLEGEKTPQVLRA